MAGLLVLSVIVGYLFLGKWLLGHAKTRPIKLLVLVGLILFPTADAIYGRIKLKQLCAAEGGMKITKVINDVEGFYDEFSPLQGLVSDGVYKFIEGDLKGKFYRFSLDQNGKLRREDNVKPISQFGYKIISDEPTNTYQYVRNIVYEISTNQELGRKTYIAYHGGWVERFIASTAAQIPDAAQCNPEKINRIDFVQLVLQPKLKGE